MKSSKGQPRSYTNLDQDNKWVKANVEYFITQFIKYLGHGPTLSPGNQAVRFLLPCQWDMGISKWPAVCTVSECFIVTRIPNIHCKYSHPDSRDTVTKIDLFCAILSPDRSPSDDNDAFLVCSSHMFHAAFLLIKGPHVALEYITCILNQPGIDSRATYSLLRFCNWKI